MTAVADGWKSSTLGELGRYMNGRAFKKSEWRDRGRPIIRIQNLTGSRAAFNYFQGDVEDRYVARSGDLLVSWAATLGAFIWSGPEAVVNQHIFKVESNIDVRFHKYLLDYKLEELMRHTHGSGMVHITRGKFDSLPVSIPHSEGEQRRIVEILEDHLSRLDAADTLIHDVRRRALMLRASGRLQAFEHLLRHGVATEQALLEVAVIANGQTPKGLNDVAVEPDAESVPFFKVGDMNASGGRYMSTARTYLSRLGIRELGLAVRPAGTVLIPKRGGAIATNKKRILSSVACYDLNTMGLIPGPELLGEYLWHWFETVDLGRLADGSNVPQINAPQIRALCLPVPPLDEQQRLVQELDDLDVAVGRLEASMSGARSTALRRALLSAAFTGCLTGRTGNEEIVEELASV